MLDTLTGPPVYYAQHGPITDPGPYAHLFAGLPTDIHALAAVVRGLLFHYHEGGIYEHEVSLARVRNDAARTVVEMLEKIRARNDAPLTVARPLAQRLVGCCRDYAVLLTAMLRHQGVPARTRFGFSRYFTPDFAWDHVVCEYWNAAQARWLLIDAQQDALHCRRNHLPCDAHDIPHAAFPFAGAVWQQARAGTIDAARYGFDPRQAGMWVIQAYLVHDLAALNKREMLIGDVWGPAKRGPSDPVSGRDATLLDQVAALTLTGNRGFAAVRAIYEFHPALYVPPAVDHYSLAEEFQAGVPVAV
jgi:hypothetical protein